MSDAEKLKPLEDFFKDFFKEKKKRVTLENQKKFWKEFEPYYNLKMNISSVRKLSVDYNALMKFPETVRKLFIFYGISIFVEPSSPAELKSDDFIPMSLEQPVEEELTRPIDDDSTPSSVQPIEVFQSDNTYDRFIDDAVRKSEETNLIEESIRNAREEEKNIREQKKKEKEITILTKTRHIRDTIYQEYETKRNKNETDLIQKALKNRSSKKELTANVLRRETKERETKGKETVSLLTDYTDLMRKIFDTEKYLNELKERSFRLKRELEDDRSESSSSRSRYY